MIRFEAVNAKHGDAILLRYTTGDKKGFWIIDGGPGGTWKRFLRPRLEEISKGKTLLVDLAMLSHVDEDHVTGMLQMCKGLAEEEADAADFLDIKRFWHNSFADLVGSEAMLKKGTAALAGAGAAAAAAMASPHPSMEVVGGTLDERAVAVLASISQGRELRDYLTQMKLDGNDPFNDTISSAIGSKTVAGAKVTIVGPIASRLEVFRQKWEVAAASAASVASLFRDDLDESPTNLSSLVMLVKIDGRKILLTGDARGDDIIEGCKDAKLTLPMKLDILKMPHHGSDRNMTEDFLKAFPAKHYVISADGRHGNPDLNTVRAIVAARDDADYTMHFTNDVPKLRPLLKKLQKDQPFKFKIRAKDDLSIAVELE